MFIVMAMRGSGGQVGAQRFKSCLCALLYLSVLRDKYKANTSHHDHLRRDTDLKICPFCIPLEIFCSSPETLLRV